MTTEHVRVRRYLDRQRLAEAVARELLGTLIELQAKQPLVQLCLCAGTTAAAIYRELARMAPESLLDASRLELWWSDETYLSTDDQARHASEALSLLGGALTLNPSRIHPMPARSSIQDVSDAAMRYATDIEGVRFDICLLSLGQAGQVASIFSGHPADTTTSSLVMGLSDAPHPPAERLTITMPMVNRSRSVWIIASGELKADAVADSLDGYTALPAARARGTHQTLWFIDRDAGSKLHAYRCPA